MNKKESMHGKIGDKVARLRKRIRIGTPAPEGQRMVDQDAEKELLEIVDWYSGNIDGILVADAKLIAREFKLCKRINFWYSDTEHKVKKAIDNLEKYFVKS